MRSILSPPAEAVRTAAGTAQLAGQVVRELGGKLLENIQPEDVPEETVAQRALRKQAVERAIRNLGTPHD